MRTRTRLIAVSALALAGIVGTGAVQARPDISVTIGAPVLLAPPLPHMVVRPGPVYVQPAPTYYYEPAYRHRHHGYQEPTRWDRDGDGVPNRRDRVYNPRWDRDGDGVPNRRDARPNNPNWR